MYIQIHVSICVHACRFILRIVYHIRSIVNYKQKQVFSVNTFTKHLHPIARENNVSVLVSKNFFFIKPANIQEKKLQVSNNLSDPT